MVFIGAVGKKLISYNGRGLAFVPPCRQPDFSTKVYGGMTLSPCCKQWGLLAESPIRSTRKKEKILKGGF